MQAKIEKWAKANQDKVLHFIAGMCLSLLIIFNWWFILVPLGIGIGKEVFDKYIRKTKFDTMDILATWFGIVPIVLVLLIDKFIIV